MRTLHLADITVGTWLFLFGRKQDQKIEITDRVPFDTCMPQIGLQMLGVQRRQRSIDRSPFGVLVFAHGSFLSAGAVPDTSSRLYSTRTSVKTC